MGCDVALGQSQISELLVGAREVHGDLFKDTYLYSGHWCAGLRVAGLDGHPCRLYSSFCFLWVQCVSVEYLGVVVLRRPRTTAGGDGGGRAGQKGKVSRDHFLAKGVWDHHILRIKYGAGTWM